METACSTQAAEARRKERFGMMLMSKYPARKATDLFVVLTEFIYELRERGILEGTLYSIEDPRVLVRLRETVKKDEEMKQKFKKNLKAIDQILVDYILFLREDETLEA